MSNLERRIDNLEKQTGGKGVILMKIVEEGEKPPRSPTEAELRMLWLRGMGQMVCWCGMMENSGNVEVQNDTRKAY